jgi:aminoglycoside 6'-N-acetyltransferase I
MLKIIPYSNKNLEQYLNLVSKLWHDIEKREILETINDHKEKLGYIILAVVDKKVVGFINSRIRNDYVEGSESAKTGYIEGIFVINEYRKQNIAKKMFQHLVKYYKTLNILYIGSDYLIRNKTSREFHKAIGFKEVSINRHYIFRSK